MEYTNQIEGKENIENYFKQIITEFQQILDENAIVQKRSEIKTLRTTFERLYQELFENQKQQFLDENPEATPEDFDFKFPLKSKFDDLVNTYKERKKKVYHQLKKEYQENLNKKQELINELKQIIDEPVTNYAESLKKVFEIKDIWRKTGPVPAEERTILWNDYQFNLERFFDQLHLDSAIRDKEFKNNLEQKENIIKQAEALLEKEDTLAAFKDLQTLHRIWKEEIGPVSKEHREAIWERFSEITTKIHEKREAYKEQMRALEEKNFEFKEQILEQVRGVNQLHFKSHKDWQDAIVAMDKLRKAFEQGGRVPKDKKEEQWQNLKNELRTFNQNKNNFYKIQKKKQQEILEVRYQMIEKAEALKDSDDFENTAKKLKDLQREWKNAGAIPRKHADELWLKFKEACNHFFNRYHENIEQKNKDLLENYEKKSAFLDDLETFENTGDPQQDVAKIKEIISTWKNLGRVPENQRNIEVKFNKKIDEMFEKVDLSRRESQLIVFNSKLEELVANKDKNAIVKEQNFIRKKIEDIHAELLQLENNLQFFASSKKEHPLLREAKKNIEKTKEIQKIWKEKLLIIKNTLKTLEE